MRYIESRRRLNEEIKYIKPGQCLKIKGSFDEFWPNPRFPFADDGLEPKSRAKKWFSQQGVVAFENPVDDTITIERRYYSMMEIDTKFKSDVTIKILGAGITNPSLMDKQDCRLYLNSIVSEVEKQSWLKMVTLGFLDPGRGWSVEGFLRSLNQVEHDIKLVRLRLFELANKKDIDNATQPDTPV